MSKRTLKFQMMMSHAEAEVLDNWMFTNRLRSRAQAIRHLTAAAIEFDAAVTQAWEALAWGINYDSEDKIMARALASIDAARAKLRAFK